MTVKLKSGASQLDNRGGKLPRTKGVAHNFWNSCVFWSLHSAGQCGEGFPVLISRLSFRRVHLLFWDQAAQTHAKARTLAVHIQTCVTPLDIRKINSARVCVCVCVHAGMHACVWVLFYVNCLHHCAGTVLTLFTIGC